MDILKVSNLSKKYKDKIILDNVNFNVKKGDVHLFIGNNGSGKTTLIKCLIDAYRKFSGSIEINDKPHNSIKNKLKIGYIPEKIVFPKNMTIDNFIFYMTFLSGYTWKESKIRKDELIKENHLDQISKSKLTKLSSGQIKKVLLAQSLINNPDILIMDEPIANLDPNIQNEVIKTLIRLNKEGKTIFITTHLFSYFEEIANHITILDKGKIIRSTTKDEFLKINKAKTIYDAFLNETKEVKNA
ncbi:MAG: ABC transporter ATP-binding protein [Mycoplasma sp.]|nr:ABC transporter ATP-binding protein [Mycoplasma sp.]